MALVQVQHDTYENFRTATLGQSYDIDGYPVSQPYQCWDYVDLLYQQNDVGQYLYTAANIGQGSDGVNTCWSNAECRQRNGSGHFSQIDRRQDIKKGDIIVFDQYTDWYGSTGHIGFADEDYNGTDYIRLLSQNFYGHHYVVIEQAYLGQAFLGAFRYDAWASPTPPPSHNRKNKFPWAVAWHNWY